jgi:hypothetical protein
LRTGIRWYLSAGYPTTRPDKSLARYICCFAPLICSITIDTMAPARRPIKPVYVKKFLELIDEVAHEKD